MLALMLLVDGQQRPAGSEAMMEKGSGRASLAPAQYKCLLIAKCSGNLCSKEGDGTRGSLKGQSGAFGGLDV